MIMGFRFYNSCMGDRPLGGEIVGIRHVCGNVGIYGPVLGEVSIKHFKGVEYVSEQIDKVLKNYVIRRGRFGDTISDLKDTILDGDSQMAVLWGLKLDPMTIEKIITNKAALNPDIRDPAKVSMFDLYNASTAYVSYRSGGDKQMVTNMELSRRISRFFSVPADELIDTGNDLMKRYYEDADPLPELVVE